MTPSADLAYHVLRLEQQLKAYQKLHAEEFEELWRALNEFKKALADLAEDRAASPPAPLPRDDSGKEALTR